MKYDRKEDYNYIRWAALVKERDQYTCQICGLMNIELHSHHKNAWNLFIDDRYNVGNGSTLCSDCHEQFHNIYGRGNNTALQFEEFKLISEAIKKSATKNISVESVASVIHKHMNAHIKDGLLLEGISDEDDDGTSDPGIQICTA